jgi:hypothetical protein
MTPQTRRKLGREIAELVREAETKFTLPGMGLKKRQWVLRQAKKRAPKGDSSSADFAAWFAAHALRFAIEVAVAALDPKG